MIRDLRSWLPRLGGSRCGERRKQGGGPGAEPADGEEECPGGNARVRWRSADAEVGAGSRGGASGKRETHTRSISVQNGQDGRRSRGRRRRSTRQGRDERHAGRGNTARDTTGSVGMRVGDAIDPWRPRKTIIFHVCLRAGGTEYCWGYPTEAAGVSVPPPRSPGRPQTSIT
jgi:hypothetical protein